MRASLREASAMLAARPFPRARKRTRARRVRRVSQAPVMALRASSPHPGLCASAAQRAFVCAKTTVSRSSAHARVARCASVGRAERDALSARVFATSIAPIARCFEGESAQGPTFVCFCCFARSGPARRRAARLAARQTRSAVLPLSSLKTRAHAHQPAPAREREQRTHIGRETSPAVSLGAQQQAAARSSTLSSLP